jgi:hypothetical protein
MERKLWGSKHDLQETTHFIRTIDMVVLRFNAGNTDEEYSWGSKFCPLKNAAMKSDVAVQKPTSQPDTAQPHIWSRPSNDALLIVTLFNF